MDTCEKQLGSAAGGSGLMKDEFLLMVQGVVLFKNRFLFDRSKMGIRNFLRKELVDSFR